MHGIWWSGDEEPEDNWEAVPFGSVDVPLSLFQHLPHAGEASADYYSQSITILCQRARLWQPYSR